MGFLTTSRLHCSWKCLWALTPAAHSLVERQSFTHGVIFIQSQKALALLLLIKKMYRSIWIKIFPDKGLERTACSGNSALVGIQLQVLSLNFRDVVLSIGVWLWAWGFMIVHKSGIDYQVWWSSHWEINIIMWVNITLNIITSQQTAWLS